MVAIGREFSFLIDFSTSKHAELYSVLGMVESYSKQLATAFPAVTLLLNYLLKSVIASTASWLIPADWTLGFIPLGTLSLHIVQRGLIPNAARSTSSCTCLLAPGGLSDPYLGHCTSLNSQLPRIKRARSTLPTYPPTLQNRFHLSPWTERTMDTANCSRFLDLLHIRRPALQNLPPCSLLLWHHTLLVKVTYGTSTFQCLPSVTTNVRPFHGPMTMSAFASSVTMRLMRTQCCTTDCHHHPQSTALPRSLQSARLSPASLIQPTDCFLCHIPLVIHQRVNGDSSKLLSWTARPFTHHASRMTASLLMFTPCITITFSLMPLISGTGFSITPFAITPTRCHP
jgi:hypothetical protein